MNRFIRNLLHDVAMACFVGFLYCFIFCALLYKLWEQIK